MEVSPLDEEENRFLDRLGLVPRSNRAGYADIHLHTRCPLGELTCDGPRGLELL
jgi:hypothetical protein